MYCTCISFVIVSWTQLIFLAFKFSYCMSHRKRTAAQAAQLETEELDTEEELSDLEPEEKRHLKAVEISFRLKYELLMYM